MHRARFATIRAIPPSMVVACAMGVAIGFTVAAMLALSDALPSEIATALKPAEESSSFSTETLGVLILRGVNYFRRCGRSNCRRADESISVDQAVVSRLFAGSQMEADVTHEMNRRGDLIAALSDVAKARKPASTADIEGLWSRVLDHAFIVMQALP